MGLIVTQKKTKPLTKYSFSIDYVILHPPPTALDKCPRCEKTHKRIKPLKLGKPMNFYDPMGKLTAIASHWAACPKTKEPVVLFDRAETGKSNSTMTVKMASVTGVAPEKKPQQLRVKYVGGKTQSWVFDPNSVERIVPGTKKEAAAQRARVRAQEKAARSFVPTPLGEEKVTLASGPPLKAPKSKRR